MRLLFHESDFRRCFVALRLFSHCLRPDHEAFHRHSRRPSAITAGDVRPVIRRTAALPATGKPATATSSPLLWGEDASALYGRTITTDGGKYVEVLPASMSANTPDVSGMLTCLSCHDGNFAPAAMMKNKVYEALPATYGNRNTVPTLIASAWGRKLYQRTSHGVECDHRLRRRNRTGTARR